MVRKKIKLNLVDGWQDNIKSMIINNVDKKKMDATLMGRKLPSEKKMLEAISFRKFHFSEYEDILSNDATMWIYEHRNDAHDVVLDARIVLGERRKLGMRSKLSLEQLKKLIRQNKATKVRLEKARQKKIEEEEERLKIRSRVSPNAPKTVIKRRRK